MTAFEIEHFDPRDNAEAFVTLDGAEVVRCAACERLLHNCSCCEFCDQPLCVCEPLTMREYRAMAARYDGSPQRVKPR